MTLIGVGGQGGRDAEPRASEPQPGAKEEEAEKEPNMEGLQARLQDALAVAESRMATLKARRLLRAANQQPERPDDDALAALDTSMKRNNALIKRLRSVAEDTKASILDDLLKTNQTKFVSEAVEALASSLPKGKDVAAVVEVLSCMHQRYSDVEPALLPALNASFHASVQEGGSGGSDKGPAVGRKRAVLRLMSELHLVGLVPDSSAVSTLVHELATTDWRKDSAASGAVLGVLASWAKLAREEFLGLVPKWTPADMDRDLQACEDTVPSLPCGMKEQLPSWYRIKAQLEDEMSRRYQLQPPKQGELFRFLERAFRDASAVLVEHHNQLLETEERNVHIMTTKGDLPADLAGQYQAFRRMYEDLRRSLSTLADSLDLEMPQLQEPLMTRLGAGAGDVKVLRTRDDADGMSGGVGLPLFDDEVTRAFYQDLPDLRELVAAFDTAAEGKAAGDEAPADAEEAAEAAEGADPHEAKPEPAKTGEAGSSLDVLQSGLQEHCGAGQEEGDGWAVQMAEACIGSKPLRKRLAKALWGSSRTSSHLLPRMSRVAATLAQEFPEIASELVLLLEQEATKLQGQTDVTARTLERRLTLMRFLGELAKFRLAPPGTVFTLLRGLLDRFQGHNVDAACALVDTAGRFLMRCPETRLRMENMLEVMMRLRGQRNLDSRQQSLVEAAFFGARSSSTVLRAKRSKLTPMQMYVEKLVLEDLCEDTRQEVCRKLRKLPWASAAAAAAAPGEAGADAPEVEPGPSVQDFLLQCCLEVVNLRHSSVTNVAWLLAMLGMYHDGFTVAAIDCLLEAVVAGLDHPQVTSCQRRIGHMLLLGSAYTWRLLDSRIVFDTLHLLLVHGWESPESAVRLDPPDDYFRVRLAAALLDCCGHYFSAGAARRRLECFLLYFQRYLLVKEKPLPLDVDFLLQDLFEKLGQQQPRHSSLEEVCRAIEQLEAADSCIPDGADGGGEPPRSSGGEADAGPVAAAAVEDAAADGDGVRTAQAGAEAGENGVSRAHSGGAPASAEADEADDEFERELAAVLLQSQGFQATGPPAADAEAAHLAAPAAADAPPHARQQSEEEAGQGEEVRLKMLVKKGGRPESGRELLVPMSATLAARVRSRESKEEEERAQVKRLVLAASRRQDQEQQIERRRAGIAAAGGAGRRARGGRGTASDAVAAVALIGGGSAAAASGSQPVLTGPGVGSRGRGRGPGRGGGRRQS